MALASGVSGLVTLLAPLMAYSAYKRVKLAHDQELAYNFMDQVHRIAALDYSKSPTSSSKTSSQHSKIDGSRLDDHSAQNESV